MDTQNADHPIRREIQRMCGQYQFTVLFSQDTEGMKTFPHIPGIVGVKCLITNKDGKAVGEGHGSAILTRINKSIERTAFICLNAAFLSAANNMCKIWDYLRLDSMDEQKISPNKMLGQAYRATETDGFEPASEKQCQYLTQLVQINCEEEEREKWLGQIGSLTKEEASLAIAQFVK